MAKRVFFLFARTQHSVLTHTHTHQSSTHLSISMSGWEVQQKKKLTKRVRFTRAQFFFFFEFSAANRRLNASNASNRLTWLTASKTARSPQLTTEPQPPIPNPPPPPAVRKPIPPQTVHCKKKTSTQYY